MKVTRTIPEIRSLTSEWKREGERIALVPTMGFFHEGHLALMRKGRELADRVVVSLFVNPTQFGPNEDFEQYPRDFERDLALAEGAGVDVLFSPEPNEMYPPGHSTAVEVEGLTNGLCGASRPGHFRGVATVVAKLFNIVAPDIAIFGEKDFQQLQVIRRFTKDLDFPVEIVGHPIVREEDGLAMSSRNSYLSPEERRSATCLFRALQKARDMASQGPVSAAGLKEALEKEILATPHTRIDYIFAGDPETLEEQDEVGRGSLVALAVWVGKTRLIDNAIL